MQYFERLKGELWDELQDSGISVRSSEREPHLYSWKGDAGLFHLDALAGGSAAFRSNGAAEAERRVYQPYYGAAARGHFWNIGFYSDNRIFSEWGSAKYFQNYDASVGYPRNAEMDSSRATWDMSDSYFVFGIRGIHVEYGRDNLAWGPSQSGGLMFSGLAPSMDMLRIRFRHRSGRLHLVPRTVARPRPPEMGVGPPRRVHARDAVSASEFRTPLFTRTGGWNPRISIPSCPSSFHSIPSATATTWSSRSTRPSNASDR